MAWLSGWTYRKLVTISRADGLVTNYQMKLLVGESSGATGEDVDCNSHVQSGFHDLAFTTSNGITILNYWVESITGISPNQLATVWIKFDSIGTGDTTFYMYYGNAAIPDPIGAPTTCQWKRYPSNPVFVVGAAGKWDDWWAQFNTIWKEGSTYYGYYQGAQDDQLFGIGLATSTDGVTWTRDTTADGKVLDVGAEDDWDDNLVGYPCVWKEGSTWYMLYSGKNHTSGHSQIGLATSTDGIEWTKSESNPVITNGVTLDTDIMQPGTRMLKEDTTYYFYYWGDIAYGLSATSKVMLATSTDLTTWTKSPNNPMLSGGGTTKWDTAVLAPTVMKFGSTYYMWFQGVFNDVGDFGLSYVGLATSESKDDDWVKSTGNPVLGTGGGVRGTGGAIWDNSWSEAGILVDFGTEWRMYYGGSKGNLAVPRCQAGFATYAKKGVGADTFILFDDFERVPYDAVGGDWTVVTDSPIISLDQSYGGSKSCKSPDTADMNIPQTASANIAIRFRAWKTEWSGFNLTHGDGTHGLQLQVTNDEDIRFYNGTGYTDTGYNIALNTWQLFEVSNIILGTSLDIWFEGEKIVDEGACDWAASYSTNQIRLNNAGADCYFDNLIVRNYRATEPAWGSWGGEEEEARVPRHGVSNFQNPGIA